MTLYFRLVVDANAIHTIDVAATRAAVIALPIATGAGNHATDCAYGDVVDHHLDAIILPVAHNTSASLGQ